MTTIPELKARIAHLEDKPEFYEDDNFVDCSKSILKDWLADAESREVEYQRVMDKWKDSIKQGTAFEEAANGLRSEVESLRTENNALRALRRGRVTVDRVGEGKE